MAISNISSPKWANADHTLIDFSAQLGELSIEYSAASDNPLFAAAVSGAYGPIAAYVPPTLAKAALITYTNVATKKALSAARNYVIDSVAVSSDATPDTRIDLSTLSQWGNANPTASKSWIDNSNVVTSLTGAQLVALAADVNSFALSVYAINASALSAIAAGTITSTAQIDALTWP